jgi:hypothetical protein
MLGGLGEALCSVDRAEKDRSSRVREIATLKT